MKRGSFDFDIFVLIFFQLLDRDAVCSRLRGDAAVVASCVISGGEALPAAAAGGGGVPDLLSSIGEADARLVVHVGWSVRVQGCGRVVMVSSHTFALLLHYTP